MADLPPPASLPYPECVPVLTDGVITLRAHLAEDIPRIVAQCNDSQSMDNLPLPRPYGVAEARAFLDTVREAWERPGGNREWVVTDESGAFLGSVNLHARADRRAEVGFAMHPDARGRGRCARAVRLLAERAFDEGAEVLRWRAVAGNWGSRRVAWACGFDVPVTVTAGGLDHAGTPRDVWHAALRRAEPMQPRYPWRDVPTLRGPRVRLRELGDEDGQWLPERVDPAGARLGSAAMPTSGEYAAWLAQVRERAAVGESVQWAVTDRHTDVVLGAVQVFGLGTSGGVRGGRVGYWLPADHCGRGLIGEAVDLVVDAAFRPEAEGGLGLTRLGADCAADNLASAQVLRGCGFLPSGRDRAALDPGIGPGVDLARFELLATDDRDAQRVRPCVVPVLQTQRLRLRPWADTDAPDPSDDPDEKATRFMPAGAQPTAARFAEWLGVRRAQVDTGEVVSWCIADRVSDRALGGILLFRLGVVPGRFQGELGYWLFPSARGHRFVAEAIVPVLEHAFRPVTDGGLGLVRVHAGADRDNEASQAVLRSAGLREWGRDRQAWRRADGSLADGVYFELLANDPR
jgi:RimJ/RimL family protein N-acetyltransferase